MTTGMAWGAPAGVPNELIGMILDRCESAFSSEEDGLRFYLRHCPSERLCHHVASGSAKPIPIADFIEKPETAPKNAC
jgi:hypothetical protein